MTYEPPCKITQKIINLTAEISEKIGKLSAASSAKIDLRLRRQNNIRTIHYSLAIENNSLSVDQITAIIDGKRVLGARQEILEVQNAYEVYDRIEDYDPYSIADLLTVHGRLMLNLVNDAGQFRSGGVGVVAGDKVVHVAPPALIVPSHMANLMHWLRYSQLNMLVKSCIFHYEFEFLHPFHDGNGRMGRLCQTLLLIRYNSIFASLPIEKIIKQRQQSYYDSLGKADKNSDASDFVEFMLCVIRDALDELQCQHKMPDKVNVLLDAMGDIALSSKELMHLVNATRIQTFREQYLNPALELGLVKMTEPNCPRSRNQKYYKIL